MRGGGRAVVRAGASRAQVADGKGVTTGPPARTLRAGRAAIYKNEVDTQDIAVQLGTIHVHLSVAGVGAGLELDLGEPLQPVGQGRSGQGRPSRA